MRNWCRETQERHVHIFFWNAFSRAHTARTPHDPATQSDLTQ